MTVFALCAAFAFGWAGKGVWVRANDRFNAQIAAELAVTAARRTMLGVSAAAGGDVDGTRW